MLQEITGRFCKLKTFNGSNEKRATGSKEVVFLVFSDHFRGIARVKRG
jgi:hypothetical protein